MISITLYSIKKLLLKAFEIRLNFKTKIKHDTITNTFLRIFVL